jgi:hypothetical protein
MRDVDDVEDAERNRNAESHSGVKPAEQDARDQGIDYQIEAETHLFPPVAQIAPNTYSADERILFWSPVCRKGAALASVPISEFASPCGTL